MPSVRCQGARILRYKSWLFSIPAFQSWTRQPIFRIREWCWLILVLSCHVARVMGAGSLSGVMINRFAFIRAATATPSLPRMMSIPELDRSRRSFVSYMALAQ